MFKSMDGGTSWSEITNDLISSGDVNALTLDPSNPAVIYAGLTGVYNNTDGTYVSILKSMDGGSTWKPAFFTKNANIAVRVILIYPLNPSIIYSGTVYGVFKSVSGGE
jgi:photosystem II stability/assembly factor-like uncharacterized protein